VQAVKVKICGITREDDALAAVELGADALGINFWPKSKRYCPAKRARRVLRGLPPLVTRVGVFVNQTAEEIRAAAEEAELDLVQLHGDETPAFCRALGLPFLKALRVEGPIAVSRARSFKGRGLLLDAPSAGFGGSGQAFDWTLARPITAVVPVLLAGGLNARNVREAIRAARPFGVDVASGVESSPGVKDRREMARFVRAAKEGA
jgi:phosphoribosylanthranilate isomerase